MFVRRRAGTVQTGRRRIALVAIPIVIALIAFAWVSSPRRTPELRGQTLAAELGCFSCHGPGGTGGVPNVNSEEAEIPSWDGGTSMMYVESEDEIREWILYGHTKREEASRKSHDEGTDARPHRSRGPHSLPVHMPAYDKRINKRQLEDLVAYYRAVANFGDMPADAREGYRVARRAGCFGCHGPGGRTGAANPRSFKGYIPPWHGADYRELVKNDDELREWIEHGKIDRFEGNRLAQYFTRRQVIQMPAYEDVLSEGEIAQVADYIRWLQQ